MTAAGKKSFPFGESLVLARTKQAVIDEYTKSSALPNDDGKAKWGSPESMSNRFKLGIGLVQWDEVGVWLDVGCSTGQFFSAVEEQGHHFKKIIGIDITEAIIGQASARSFESPTRFAAADLEAVPEDITEVDLLTMVGILQLCGCGLNKAIHATVKRLKPSGQIFLTTKHLGWKEFSKPGFVPNPDHSWFLFDDVRGALEENGVEITTAGGFIPREGEIVPLEDSHTFYIYGRKHA